MFDLVFRFYYSVQGGHTHVRLFAGKGTLGKCGNIVFRNEEWIDFMERCSQSSFEFICDEPQGEV